MHAPLVTVRSPNRQALTLVVDKRLELGREADGVVIVDSLVSRRHVALEPGSGGTVLVTDLGSANGTTVDGEPIGAPTEVGAGSQVQIGDTRIEVGGLGEVGGPARNVGYTELVSPSRAVHTSIGAVADAAADDLQAHVLDIDDEPGTLTVMFSDIESSTELAVVLGDSVWFDVLQRHARLVDAHVKAQRGRIVKHRGDGYMLSFRSARSALRAAIGLQRDLAETAWSPPGQELRVRIGMHTGEMVIDESGDLFGKHVIVAARIGDLAEGEEILVSSLVRQIAEPRGDITFTSPRVVELRGIGDTETVWTVDWRSYENA